jgi:hypothetical protein
MKLNTFTIVITVVTSAVFRLNADAQQSIVDYDLGNYKLPNIKRHELEFNLDILGYSDSWKQDEENNVSVETNLLKIYSKFAPFYSFYLNTNTLQFDQYVYANLPNVSISDEKSNTSNYRNILIDPSLNYSGGFREYLKNKLYLEQDISLGISARNDHRFTEYLSDTTNNVYEDLTVNVTGQNVDISVPVLVGWGRVERVEDARLAVYILDDLKKAGQLIREISKDDIEILARRISEVRNERFFDSRLKKIWELQQIDSLLVDMELIRTGNITYFTLLNDNWDYSNGPIRESGFRISAGVSPEFDWTNDKFSQEYRYYDPDTSTSTQEQHTDREIRGNILIRINYMKPLNLYWQLTVNNQFNASKSFSKFQDNYNDLMDTLLFDAIGLYNTTYASIGYYPNSRTAMHLYAEEILIYSKTSPEEGEISNETELITRFGIQMNYYISPRLRLNLNSLFVYDIDREKNLIDTSTKELDFNFNMQLIYKLL